LIPNMLIQPQLENAVWHGLRYKESTGSLSLTFSAQGENIRVVIEDNGIGLKKSMELKTAHQKAHNSRGQTNTRERINLLNHLYNTKITMDITDKAGVESGVIVAFVFPILNKDAIFHQ
jgi:Predicted signal transduction protein with a C-terminal ATPase domain